MVEKKDTKNEVAIMNILDGEVYKSLDMKITKEDIIAYRVSKEEDRLESEKDVINAEIKDLKVKIVNIDKEIDEYRIKTVESTYGTAVKNLKKAYEVLNIKKDVFILKSNLNEEDGKIIVSLESGGYYGSNNLDSIQIPVGLNNLVKEKESTQAEITDRINKLSVIMNQLLNMGRLERKCTSIVVERMLEKNAKAKSLISK